MNAGDLVVAMLGETLPRACIVPDYVPPAIVKADCARFSTCRELLRPRYAESVLNAWSTRKRASGLISGVGRPRLNLTKIRQLAVPLAPIAEQEEIANEVERIFTIIEKSEQVIEINVVRSERLRQSVLKRAFNGTLSQTNQKTDAHK